MDTAKIFCLFLYLCLIVHNHTVVSIPNSLMLVHSEGNQERRKGSEQRDYNPTHTHLGFDMQGFSSHDSSPETRATLPASRTPQCFTLWVYEIMRLHIISPSHYPVAHDHCVVKRGMV